MADGTALLPGLRTSLPQRRPDAPLTPDSSEDEQIAHHFFNLAERTALPREELLRLLRCDGEYASGSRERSLTFLRRADEITVDDPGSAYEQVELLLWVWFLVGADCDAFERTLDFGDPSVAFLIASKQLGSAVRRLQQSPQYIERENTAASAR